MAKDHDRGAPRVLEAERRQVELRAVDLESLLPEGHRARSVWAVVEALDLSEFYGAIAARGSTPGRPASDPKILLTLWIYATSEGVGSARHLSRLCERDDAYRWICGGVTPNHHTLSDFRVEHGEKLDRLLTQLVASLMNARVLSLRRVAQDGTRVRASAGAGSFRRGSTLERCLEQAQAQVRALREELQADPHASTERERAARERAAQERESAVARALAELPKVQKVHERNQRRAGRAKRRKGSGASEPRVSTTDPEARVMKMGDGGFRPAYNVQFVTDAETRIVVAVDVTNEGT
jgi:transposase